MVIQGAITYEGVDYGVNELQERYLQLPLQVLPLMQTRTSAGFPAVVIAHYDINQINFQPDFLSGMFVEADYLRVFEQWHV